MNPRRKNELDVDFIGGQDPLTKEEEKAISDYIMAKKVAKRRLLVPEKRAIKRRKSTI